MMDIDWKQYFDNLAMIETSEHKKVGWGSDNSMYSKFYVALSLLPLDDKKRLLDIGCGTGAFVELLASNYPSLEIHAIDISEKQLEIVRQKNIIANFEIGSITNIPYPDSFFECVTCFGVLQNFNGLLNSAITEMSRVLKKGGNLFVTALDANYSGFKSGERKPNPINIYSVPEELIILIESAGILVTKMGALSSNELEGSIVPLHTWHTFFIFGRK